jgi:hypothetical protein
MEPLTKIEGYFFGMHFTSTSKTRRHNVTLKGRARCGCTNVLCTTYSTQMYIPLADILYVE